MTFKVNRASDIICSISYYKTFETLEQLRDFVIKENEKRKSCIIYWDSMELIIYDDWIE